MNISEGLLLLIRAREVFLAAGKRSLAADALSLILDAQAEHRSDMRNAERQGRLIELEQQ